MRSFSDNSFLKESILFGDFPSGPESTIYVLTYNQEDYINECLMAILNQSYTDYHIIVHDDNSTDATLLNVLEIYKRYPKKISIIAQQENKFNQNYPILFNLINISQTRYIFFCEGDDFWNYYKKLEIQISYLNNNECVMTYSNPSMLSSLNSSYGDELEKHLSHYGGKVLEGNSIKGLLRKSNFIMTSSVGLIKFPIPDFYLHLNFRLIPEDWFVFIYYSKLGEIKFDPRKFINYRIHDKSLWSSMNTLDRNKLVADSLSNFLKLDSDLLN